MRNRVRFINKIYKHNSFSSHGTAAAPHGFNTAGDGSLLQCLSLLTIENETLVAHALQITFQNVKNMIIEKVMIQFA